MSAEHILRPKEEWEQIEAEQRKAEDEAAAKRKVQGEVVGPQTSNKLVLPDSNEISPYFPIPQKEISEVKRLHEDIITTPLKVFRLGDLLASQLELIPHGSREKWCEQTYPEIGLTTIRLWIRIAKNRNRLEERFPIIRQQLPISSWTKTDLDLLPSVRQMRDATMEVEAQERETQGKPPIRHRSATKEKRTSRSVRNIPAEVVADAIKSPEDAVLSDNTEPQVKPAMAVSRKISPEVKALLDIPWQEKTACAPKLSRWLTIISTAQEAIRELERLQAHSHHAIDFGPVKKILDEAERRPVLDETNSEIVNDGEGV
jgi:hypothetical protein